MQLVCCHIFNFLKLTRFFFYWKSQGLPRSTRFLDTLVNYLPDWRKATAQFPVIPWNAFIEHVRVNVNPLAADDHMKEVIQQLQLMGEVIYVKGSVCVDVIGKNQRTKIDQTTVGRNIFSYISFFLTVLQPKWLSSNIIGHLASPDFIRKSRSSGFYTSHELKSVTSWEAVENILPILESLGLCAKVSTYSSSSTILSKVQVLLEEKLVLTWKRMPLIVLFFFLVPHFLTGFFLLKGQNWA